MTPRSPLVIAVAAGLLLFVTACGGADDTADISEGDPRTIEVEMTDIGFEPETLEVARGETVRFVFTNRGDVAHDAFIGDREAQDDHAADMRAGGDAHGGHADDEDAIAVEPGETGELSYTFAESGTFEIGCHQPGHYAAGMKITVEVA